MSLVRRIRSYYSRYPMVSVVVTAGLIDMVIGGTRPAWSLFWLGLLATTGTLTWRWLASRRTTTPPVPEPPRRYLTSESSASSLPMLRMNRRSNP
ncbi:MAG: hypothetical protein RMI89_03230 [Gloeomargarita sp. SKYBB_i_bin120]|nr:hypothetical protein [Gloeomargarita sp. SKYG98]MCS7291974.1 hypothetical protein [Gloeomargarita sp. SKYB120]MDW8177534.1 hypothetical protein [Gloeomargarita sp. SKYBB_i_bin120]